MEVQLMLMGLIYFPGTVLYFFLRLNEYFQVYKTGSDGFESYTVFS